MKFKGTYLKALTADDGTIELSLSTRDRGAINALKSLSGQELTVECKKWRNQRSLEANRYAWELIGQIATVLKTDSDSIYEQMIERYGVCDTVPILDSLVENEREKHRLLTEIKETTLIDDKGKSHCFVWCKCYRGSSQYDTKEMSGFIDGIVSEAQELDIETRTPEQLAEIKSMWKAEK